MKLTPIDITHKTFTKKMFGLDEGEVLDFLQKVSSAMEELIHERNSLKEIVREKEIQMGEFKDRDSALRATITTASTMADRFRQDAEREAKLILADAQQKAEIIVRDSRDSLKKMYQEMAEMKRARMQFEANLKALAQAHISLLEQGEKFMPSIGLPTVNMDQETHTAATSTGVHGHAAGTHGNQNGTRKSTQISPLSIG